MTTTTQILRCLAASLLVCTGTAGAQSLTITNARILDGTGKVIERGSIVVPVQASAELGLNQVFGTKAFSMGPLNNVSLEVGADFNTENNYVAPSKKSLVAGLQFSFGLPYKGYFNISPLYFKEWNHNAFAQIFDGVPGGNTEFADMQQAYVALDDERKAICEDLI